MQYYANVIPMSALYDQIPDERKTAYLENAQHTIEEALEPVIAELGKTVMGQATALNIQDAQSPDISDGAEQYAKDYNLQSSFLDAVEAAKEPRVATEASSYLRMHTVIQHLHDFKRPDLSDVGFNSQAAQQDDISDDPNMASAFAAIAKDDTILRMYLDLDQKPKEQ